ncbi:TipJ family phage tail tip protein [Pseudomonas juntendi]|uniref:TipJ family phage tail tip protein n=3 Tax=Pseudomonas juntendi TaxID=2666183 RepID=UPI003B96411A
MGPVDHLEITGAKGGDSKPKTPVEAPDSLQSTNIAKILLAVGEGEFDGRPTDRDIYLDNTPIMDASGNVNFPGVKWEWRPGSIEQEYIQGIPSIENETTVNVELRSDNPFTRALSNTQLSAVRVRMTWPRLAQQDSNGNTNGYRIEYAIDIATDGGAYVEAHLGAVDGKTTNGYQRSVRVNLPKATSGWMLRVRRITPNANSGTIADTMTIAGYTEIIDQKLRYPNTALLYIEFDAQQFQNIPAVTVKCKAKRWPVPTNYDPVARTYTGVWDGTFKQAWTNNPAFVTYGLCVEDRFGLGKRIKSWMVDKWEMYRIAQYCDQLVPDGVGGQEPRYLCDMNLQGRSEAWTLLRDLAAIYRGMVYWAHGSLFMQADMPRAQDIDYVFTRANVIDGDFVYGGAERNTHYSRALVSYDNPANNYDTDVIPVTDLSLQRRYRDRPIELSAIGCTRASEAQRRGKWALLSNSQDRTVTFKTGMEGRIPLPGYVIPVADELVAGRPNGGRIASAAGRVVTLDRDTPIKAGDRLILNLPNGTAQARTVQSVAGRAVTVTTDYGVQPEPELQWAIDYDDLAVQLFRVLKTTRTQEGEYEITALEFNPSKFAAIDTGAKLDERPISVIPVTTVQPPASVTLSSNHMIDQGIAVSTMTIAWPAVEGAVAYDVEWRKDNGNWIRLQRTGAASVDVVGIYAGAYLARVRAVSSFDITSIWKSSNLTQLNGKEGLPPAVTFLDTESLLFGIGIKWGFPAGAEDTQRTELWYSEGTDLGLATKLADLAYPQNEHVMQGLRAGQRFFFWARLVDRTGNLGPFFPVAPAVVAGMASADAGAILEQIKDQITESELGQELTSRIDLIDKNGPGSVNDRIGTAKTELAQQISEVNNALNTTKGNLQQQITAVSADVSAAKADLQQQIANVSALAGSLPYRKDKAYSVGQSALGSDGKLYQALKAVPLNTPPPNATYWTDVGQAVVTANGMAARVQTMETKVETLEGATSAQAQQISGLQSSLTTTNGNVSAAQQAAQDAATLAGGKGKVIVQSAAPAVADRLAQNLWIDTTSNANTPKRWSGTAWVAVTDKVATDAAAAAAGALALAQTKADATVVSSLTTRVSDAEGKLTSQATRMDGMQTSIDGKASSQALQQVTSRVTATEQKDAAQDQQLTSQSQALTSLTDSVSKKADASTVQVLGNAVTQQGQELTAQGQSLTKIDVALGQAGGENWIYNPSFEKQGVNGLADGWATAGASGVTTTPSLVPSALAAGEIAQRIDVTGVSASAWSRIGNPSTRRVEVSPGTPVSMSAFVRGTPGMNVRCEIQFLNSAGGGINGTPVASNTALTGEFNRISHTAVAPAGAVRCNYFVTVYGTAAITSGFLEADRTQIEFSSVVTGWRDNGAVDAGNAAATASAVQSLTGRVDQAESSLTSQSGSIVSLQNGLTTTNGNVSAAQQAAQDAATLAGGKGKVIVQSAAPAVADRLVQNLWIDTTSNANTPKRWSGSAWVAVTDKVATDAAAAAQSALSQVILKADSSALQTLGSTVSQQGQQITADGQAITRIDASLTQVKGDTASNALATSALTGRVGATESGLTSVSGQLTEVSNSIGNAGGENLIYNPSFEKLGANGLAEGWAVASGSGATVSPSVVASALNPKESAQRIDVTGMSASVWARIGNPSSRRIALKPGTPVTLSAYMRGTAGLNVRAEIQFLNSAGSGLPGPQASFTVASGNFARISLSAVAPDGAVECNFFVTCYGTSTISTAFMEVDRAQFELSAVMTGWRDNGQVVLADQSATSTAVDALSSAVSQQAGKIDSATSRTTALENTVNSTSSGLATKASTAAVNTLSGRVAATETGLTAASNSVNRLSSQIGAVGGTGSNLIPAEYAAFTVALPSMHKASTLTLSSEQDAAAYSGYLLKADSPSGSAWLYLAASATDYTLRLTAGRQYIFSAWAKGSAAHGVAVRLRYQSSDGSAVEVALSSVNVGTNLSRVSTVITVPAAAAGPAIVVLYTQAGAAAGTTWFDGFMLEEKVGESTAPSAFIPGTSTRQAAGQATALSSLDTKVTQQGTRIESEAKRTDGLYTAVGDANAAIQNEAKARSDADGALSQQIQSTQSSLGATNASVQQISTAQTGLNNRVNAQFSIKVAVTQSGVYALGGIGVGIQNQNGVLQSVVAVLADQFAVINAAGNGYVSPFAIQGGQVFMNDAFIRDGSIINAKIANGAITSAKIGVAEIDTLRIRGNAVTVPVSANSPGNVLGAGVGQWQNLVAVGVQMDEGGFITAQYSCYQGFGSGIRKYQFQMDINGLVIAEGGGDWADGFPNLMGSIGVGPGYFVVTVKWWGENTGVGVRNHNLFAMGTKR